MTVTTKIVESAPVVEMSVFSRQSRGLPACSNSHNSPPGMPMRFEGTSAYVATDDLKVAVNAAIALERPLLVKGEPGTGKTVLALEIAKALAAPLIEWQSNRQPRRCRDSTNTMR
jgi:transcriptional regulator with AAA-type ATPase domain